MKLTLILYLPLIKGRGDNLHARPRVDGARVRERVTVMVENEEAVEVRRRRLVTEHAVAASGTKRSRPLVHMHMVTASGAYGYRRAAAW